MKKQKVFITAAWKNLVMANYSVPPEKLEPFVPAGTELDFWEGVCYVSLVGFMFENVKVKGMPVPFHINFPEVNLRFYVKYRENGVIKRGVVFISEIVPRPAVTAIANLLYKEHYKTFPVRNELVKHGEMLTVNYQFKARDNNNISVDADLLPAPLLPGSFEEFITEHFWGYVKRKDGKTAEYEVAHPRWYVHKVRKYTINCDFGNVYGKQFSFLNGQSPVSVFLAEGSPVKVFERRITGDKARSLQLNNPTV